MGHVDLVFAVAWSSGPTNSMAARRGAQREIAAQDKGAPRHRMRPVARGFGRGVDQSLIFLISPRREKRSTASAWSRVLDIGPSFARPENDFWEWFVRPAP
jgi:hypothetical protein